MQIQYIEGDLFAAVPNDLPELGVLFIPHVVNDVPAWGAGFVLPLARHWPITKESYFSWAKKGTQAIVPFVLGGVQYVHVDADKVVCNMLAQHGVGGQPLQYTALEQCMTDVANNALAYCTRGRAVTIMAPMFGAGLAAGDWNQIEAMILKHWVNFGLPVKIHYLAHSVPKGWTPPK